ncbi:hypothetical protein B1R32_11244 [Abditibacterium utsteinense]|uniref:Uncharacterized protein n=1 Tax=Abditibacterium utsteinense TaxID=1960156 RepID=A0A2S8SRL2_9BACT|nr:hypothetical protein B1R32_11244 [Abditibacterium utsteinense]
MRRYSGYSRMFNLGRDKPLSGWVILNNLFDMSLSGTYKIKVSKRFRVLDLKIAPVTIASETLTVKVTSDSPTSGWTSVVL